MALYNFNSIFLSWKLFQDWSTYIVTQVHYFQIDLLYYWNRGALVLDWPTYIETSALLLDWPTSIETETRDFQIAVLYSQMQRCVLLAVSVIHHLPRNKDTSVKIRLFQGGGVIKFGMNRGLDWEWTKPLQNADLIGQFFNKRWELYI